MSKKLSNKIYIHMTQKDREIRMLAAVAKAARNAYIAFMSKSDFMLCHRHAK